jgi:hypothetical protein
VRDGVVARAALVVLVGGIVLAASCWGGSGPPQTACVPPPSDLVAWWPFDETSGSVAHDIAGFPNDLTFVGAVLPIPGKVGGSWELGASGAFGDTPSQGDLQLGTGSFTIETWVQRSDTSSSQSVILRKIAFPYPVGYLLATWGGQAYLFKSGTNLTPPPHSAPFATGGWRHLAVTVDRNTDVVRWYLDGQPTGTGTATAFFTGDLNNTEPLDVGTYGATIGLDELSLYKRALSASEIQAIYQAGPSGKCKPAASTATAVPPFPTLGTGGATAVPPKGTPTPTPTLPPIPTLAITAMPPKATPTPTSPKATPTPPPSVVLTTPTPTMTPTPTPTATPTPTTPTPTPTPAWTPTPTPPPVDGTLCIQKFYDVNQNGTQNANEPFLPGWSFTVSQGSAPLGQLTTGPNGTACVNLAPGTYTVSEVGQPGWFATTPNPLTITIGSGQTVTVAFGNGRQ